MRISFPVTFAAFGLALAIATPAFAQDAESLRKELEQMRKQLRSEIDSLENRVKWLNIAGMPLAVIFAGFGLAFLKRRRSGQ